MCKKWYPKKLGKNKIHYYIYATCFLLLLLLLLMLLLLLLLLVWPVCIEGDEEEVDGVSKG